LAVVAASRAVSNRVPSTLYWKSFARHTIILAPNSGSRRGYRDSLEGTGTPSGRGYWDSSRDESGRGYPDFLTQFQIHKATDAEADAQNTIREKGKFIEKM